MTEIPLVEAHFGLVFAKAAPAGRGAEARHVMGPKTPARFNNTCKLLLRARYGID